MNWLNEKITQNFRWKEFFKSITADYYNINNITDDQWVLSNIENLTEQILQPLRIEFGRIDITSGYRCIELNEQIGGSKTSDHVIGCAADIQSKKPLIDLVEWIYNNKKFNQMILEYPLDESGWIHISLHKIGNRNQLLLHDEENYYQQVNLKYLRDYCNEVV